MAMIVGLLDGFTKHIQQSNNHNNRLYSKKNGMVQNATY